jgi:hypothetical protein
MKNIVMKINRILILFVVLFFCGCFKTNMESEINDIEYITSIKEKDATYLYFKIINNSKNTLKVALEKDCVFAPSNKLGNENIIYLYPANSDSLLINEILTPKVIGFDLRSPEDFNKLEKRTINLKPFSFIYMKFTLFNLEKMNEVRNKLKLKKINLRASFTLSEYDSINKKITSKNFNSLPFNY